MIRAIVVDDEALGRRGITSRLNQGHSVEVVAECRSGREAVEAVRRHHPELLFLDVQMPGVDGFEVVRRLSERERPHIIFVTAHEQHAVRAFEVHALDYVLKPIDDERFNAVVARALKTITRDRESDLGSRIAALVSQVALNSESRRSPKERYAIKSKGRVTFVRHAEIDWVEAEGDYVRIHTGGKGWLVRETMAAMESQLGSKRFLRIHRSSIVNIDRIQELRSFENGDYAVMLREGTELRLSRTYRDAVMRLVGG